MLERRGWLGLARDTLNAIAERGPVKGVRAILRPEAVSPPSQGERIRDRDVMATSDRAVLSDRVGVRLAASASVRPRVVVHWATWCDACIDELPAVMALRAQLAGRVDFVGIGWEAFSAPTADPGAHLAAVEAAALHHGLDFETLVFEGRPEELFEALDITEHTVPQTWLVTHAGRKVFVGPLSAVSAHAIASAVDTIEPSAFP